MNFLLVIVLNIFHDYNIHGRLSYGTVLLIKTSPLATRCTTRSLYSTTDKLLIKGVSTDPTTPYKIY